MPLQVAAQVEVCHRLYTHTFNMVGLDERIDSAGVLRREAGIARPVHLVAAVAEGEEDVRHQAATQATGVRFVVEWLSSG